MSRFISWFKNNLPYLVISDVILAFITVWFFPVKKPFLSNAISILVFVMVYVMCITINIESLFKAFKSIKSISIGLTLNFLFSPLLAGLLTFIFLRDYPIMAAGLIAIGCTPAGANAAAWTGLLDGSVALAISLQTLTLLVAIVAIPAWIFILAGFYIKISIFLLIQKLLIIIVFPLFAGILTRRLIISKYGLHEFIKNKPIFPVTAGICAILIIFSAILMRGSIVFRQPFLIPLLVCPAVIYYAVSFLTPFFSAVSLRRVTVKNELQ